MLHLLNDLSIEKRGRGVNKLLTVGIVNGIFQIQEECYGSDKIKTR
jgi:hypothetical protein